VCLSGEKARFWICPAAPIDQSQRHLLLLPILRAATQAAKSTAKRKKIPISRGQSVTLYVLAVIAFSNSLMQCTSNGNDKRNFAEGKQILISYL
jgi:hypothetical protein